MNRRIIFIILHSSMYNGLTWKLKLISGILRIWFFLRFNTRKTVHKDVGELSAPYVVIGNHGNKWDPFLAAVLLRVAIHYIASDSIFRNPLLRSILKLFGAVPKKKFMPDTHAIRELFRIRSKNGIIGLFPEGQATWDGRSLNVTPATGKLLKVLKLPVVCVKFTGNYMSLPRWARFAKRGVLHAEYSLLLTPEQLSSMSPEEINRTVANAVFHDEYLALEDSPVAYRGRRRAEYLESTLFICPECHGCCSLVSHRHRLVCSHCGNSVIYTPRGTFIPSDSGKDKAPIARISDWNSFQMNYLERVYRDMDEEDKFFGDQVTLMMCKNGEDFSAVDTGTFYAKHGSFYFDGSKTRFIFMLNALQGVNIQNNEKLEFYWKDSGSGVLFLVHPDFGSKRISSLKYYLWWQIGTGNLSFRR